MRLKLSCLLLAVVLPTLWWSCNSEELVSNEKQEVSKREPIHFLSFDTAEDFVRYIEDVKSAGVGAATRSYKPQAYEDFTSISQLRGISALTRGTLFDEDEMTLDEFRVHQAELLAVDPILETVMDTTMQIVVAGRYYKVTKLGTVSSLLKDKDEALSLINKVDSSELSRYKKGDTISLSDKVMLINTFGGEEQSLVKKDSKQMTTRAITEHESPNLHEGYNTDTYKWKNNSVFQKVVDFLGGKDVSKHKEFNKARRVDLTVFDTNYGFYAAAGVKVKMQRSKRFLGIKYWVNERAHKLAIGFNYVSGVMKYKDVPPPPGVVAYKRYEYSDVHGPLSSLATSFAVEQVENVPLIKDWTNSVKSFAPIWKPINLDTRDYVDLWYKLPIEKVVSFLSRTAGAYLKNPDRRVEGTYVTSKEPRVLQIYKYDGLKLDFRQRTIAVGVVEYSNESSKTVYIGGTSGGVSWGNKSGVKGFVPSEFDFEGFDVFGAAHYYGGWAGVRIIN